MTEVTAHTGDMLDPIDVEELPPAVREVVKEHVEFTGAYDVEVRHHGGQTFDIVHRYSPDA